MSNLTPSPKYQLIGHRGTAGLRPENTYCSFSHAAELGLNWIEFDVQLTKDEQWVVIHDTSIDRTTNGTGKICDYTLAELETFEAGLWFKPPYPKQPIPTLVKTLELAKKLGLQCNIEIKDAAHDPEKLATAMARFLQQHVPSNAMQPLLSSFDLPCIVALRNLLPTLPIGYLVDNFSPNTIAIAQTNNFDSINCDVDTITTADLRSATQKNIPVLLFTIDDAATAHTWFARGVTAIFTNRPDLLQISN